MQHVLQFIRDEDGQDVVEYGLLIATIAIVVLIGVGVFGSSINAWFLTLAGRITTTGIVVDTDSRPHGLRSVDDRDRRGQPSRWSTCDRGVSRTG